MEPACSGAIAGAFLCVDASFSSPNLVKVADGGYVPLLWPACLWRHVIWHRGSTTVTQVLSERAIPVSEFMDSLGTRKIRVFPVQRFSLPGTL